MSGAQKRKRAAEEKGKIGKLLKLTLWFNTGAMSATHTVPSDIASTSVSNPATSATHTIPSDVASTFTSTPAMSATSTVLSDIASTSKSIPATNHSVSADIPIISLPVAATGYISQEEIPKSVTVKEFPIQEIDPGYGTLMILTQ